MNKRFEQWLRRATNGQKLDALLRGQWTIMNALNVLTEMEYDQMQDLSRINDKVSKIKDVAESLKTMHSDLIAERDALKAERDALLAADAGDQTEIDALEVRLADVQSTLDALKAVAAGTPVVLPPDTGGGQSTGGANPAVD